MKISNIEIIPIKSKLVNSIAMAYGTINEANHVLIKIYTDSGIVGFGEASTIPYVTGETTVSIVEVLKQFRSKLIGLDAFEIGNAHIIMDNLIYGNTAAKVAIDIALYDILGKALNKPLYKILGGYSDSFLTDVCISIDSPEKMAIAARRYADEGFEAFKIKAGRNVNKDIKAIKQIREAVGKDVVLRVDANQGWSITDSIKVIEATYDCDLEAIEQPVKYWDIEGMAEIKKKSGKVKLIADESLHSPMDAMRLIKANAADMFSIKLAKAGGIYKALQINAIAEANGIECMIGCMLETGILISAAAHFKASQRNVTVGDTDAVVLVNEPRVVNGFSYRDSMIKLTDKPGLGVDVNI